MAFQPHTYAQYLTGIHYYWCKGASIEEAAKAAHMHPTVLWRAATGWTGTNGRDGHAGRAAFLAWVKGLRADGGAPCCGAALHAGDRPLPVLEQEAQTQRMIVAQDLVDKLEATRKQLDELHDEITGRFATNTPAVRDKGPGS